MLFYKNNINLNYYQLNRLFYDFRFFNDLKDIATVSFLAKIENCNTHVSRSIQNNGSFYFRH